MKHMRIDVRLRDIVLLGCIVISGGNALAESGICSDSNVATSSGGTGMGGTGNLAKGTGMGGTGIELGVYMSAAQAAGKVTASHGSVSVQNKGRSRQLNNGDPICEGDTISTSQSASVEIKMADGGLLSVRPLTQLTIKKFIYRDTKQDRSSLLLLNGSCRIVTGEIGKQYPMNDVFKTATASIRVRAADHEVTVILKDELGKYPAGTYDKVNKGKTIISTQKGDLRIHPRQVGFAADKKAYPALLKRIPSFYSNKTTKE